MEENNNKHDDSLDTSQATTIVDTKVAILSQPHFEGVVRSPLTLPKMGFGSPPGVPKTQSAITGVKTLALRRSLYHWKGLEV